MGDSFNGEADCSARFYEVMGNFLPISKGLTELQGHSVSGAADHIFYVDGCCIVIRVDKDEMETGDAYTQISRWHVKIWRHYIIPDAPVFLLCVMGRFLAFPIVFVLILAH